MGGRGALEQSGISVSSGRRGCQANMYVGVIFFLSSARSRNGLWSIVASVCVFVHLCVPMCR